MVTCKRISNPGWQASSGVPFPCFHKALDISPTYTNPLWVTGPHSPVARESERRVVAALGSSGCSPRSRSGHWYGGRFSDFTGTTAETVCLPFNRTPLSRTRPGGVAQASMIFACGKTTLKVMIKMKTGEDGEDGGNIWLGMYMYNY
jgi:hypothetical protein